MPELIDWARLAAFIDGEGCISIIRNVKKARANGGCQLVMAVYLGGNDPRLAGWLKTTFGMGNTWIRKQKYQGKEWRPFYGWKVTGANAKTLLQGCYPYLLLKKEQADIALAFQALVHPTGNKHCRRSLTLENYNQREMLKVEMERLKHMDYEGVQLA